MLLDTPQLTRIVDTDAHEGPVYVPAENALYFTTSRPGVALRRLALDGDPTVTTVRPTANANGMTLGRDGRLIETGIAVLDPAGAQLGEIHLPGAVNFTFAGDVLFITADTAIWAATVKGL